MKYVFQRASSLNVTSRCLWSLAVVIWTSPNIRSGCGGFECFLEKIMDSVLAGLNATSHVLDQGLIFSVSLFSCSAEEFGVSQNVET